MKKITKKITSIALVLCIILTFLPTTAQAALDSRVETAISWAVSIANDNSHGYSQVNRNGPDYDCSSFVSTAFRQGGFNVSESNWTGSMEQAFTSVGFKVYAADLVALQRGDILLRHDNTQQHVELYLGNNECVAAHDNLDGQTGDSSGHEIEVRSKAYCDFCNYKQYTRVLRYEDDSSGISPLEIKEYFDCDVQIDTTKGKRVDLYSKPTDSSAKTYFDQGQTAYSTRGAKLTNGTTWYEIQAIDNGKVVTLWLNAGSRGVKVIKSKVEPELYFSTENLSIDPGESKTVSIQFQGDGVNGLGGTVEGKSLCDVNWGSTDWDKRTTSLEITAKQPGEATITVKLLDQNNDVLYSKPLHVTINDNSVTISTTPSSLELNLATNPSGTVRVDINGPHHGISGSANGSDKVRAEWIDAGSGYAVAKFTAVKAGIVDYTFRVTDETETKTLATKTIRIIVTEPTYAVSYDANGGTGAPSTQTKQYNNPLALSSTKPTRSGYTFKGWAASSEASSAQYQPGDTYTCNENIVLYAVWERTKINPSITLSPNSLTMDLGTSKTVSVNFKGDGIKYLGFSPENRNNSICNLNWADIDWENGTTSVTVTGLEPGTTTITVHLLDKDENSFFSQNFKVTVNSRSYTVSYDANGGNGAPSSQIKQAGSALILSDDIPLKPGYIFLGWSISSNATSASYPAGGTYTKDSDVTLYAVWEAAPIYVVTYDANGGTNAPSDQEKRQGVSLTLSDVIPTRTGYTFVGWAASKDAVSAVYMPGGTFTDEVSITLYAVWTKNPTYTVHFDANGGVGAPADQNKVSGVELTLSDTVPTRTGYKFSGWATRKDASTSEYGPGDIFKFDNAVTLYAVWEKQAEGPIDVTGIKLNETAIRLSEGDVEILTATVLSDNAEKQNVTWSSSNEKIATVNGGVVLGISEGEAIITACTSDGDYQATCSVVVTPVENPSVGAPQFVDVHSDAYYYDAVTWAVKTGITTGTSSNTFSPDIACTRGQVMMFLWRAAGSPEPISQRSDFADVPPDAYYRKAVVWAEEVGITSGTSHGEFSPGAIVTRGQAVTFLYRFAGSPPVEGRMFSDVSYDAFYSPAVVWAVDQGITSGTSSATFSPLQDCTRAQIVTFLYRYLC